MDQDEGIQEFYPSQVFCHNVDYFSKNVERIKRFLHKYKIDSGYYKQNGGKVPPEIDILIDTLNKDFYNRYLDLYFALASQCNRVRR